MNTIPFKVNKNIIQKIGGYSIASSENNYTKFDFQFSDDWNKVGIQVSATMFFDSDKIPDPVLLTMRNDNTGYCYLPSALKDEHGTLKLGLTGVYADDNNEKVVINTLLTSMPIGPGAFMTKYPANDIYKDILTRLSDITKKSSSFLELLNTIDFNKINRDEYTKKNIISDINSNKTGYFSSENADNVGVYNDGKYSVTTSSNNTVRSKWVFNKEVDTKNGKFYLGFEYKTNIDFNIGVKIDGTYKDLGKISAITDGNLHTFVTDIDVSSSIGLYEIFLPNKENLNCEISNIFIMTDIDYYKPYSSFEEFLKINNSYDNSIELLKNATNNLILNKINRDEYTKKNIMSDINSNKTGYFSSENADNVGVYNDGKYSVTTSSNNTVVSKWIFNKNINGVKGKFYLGFEYKTNIDFNVGVKIDGTYKDLGKISAITDGTLHTFVTDIDVSSSIGLYEIYLPNKEDLNCEISNIFIMTDIDYHKPYSSFEEFLKINNNCEISPELYGAVGDGCHDDTIAIKIAIENAISSNKKLKFQSGKVYCISSTIDLSNTSCLIIDFNWSTIKAIKSIDYMFKFDGSKNIGNDAKTLLTNVVADCNCKSGFLNLTYSFKFTLENFLIRNCEAIAINILKGGAFVCNNGTIVGDGTPNSRGIYNATSDCHFTEIIIIDMKKAIFNGGTNFYSKVHAWLSKNVSDSIFFHHFAGFASLVQCQCDTYEKGYLVHTDKDLSLVSCTYYNNPNLYDSKVDPVVFDFTSGVSAFARRICCTNCSFNNNYSSDENIRKLVTTFSTVSNAQISFVGENHFINIDGIEYISTYKPYLQSKVTDDFDGSLNKITYRNGLCYYDFSLKFSSQISASNLYEIANISSPYIPCEEEMFAVMISKTLAGSDCIYGKIFIGTDGKIKIRIPSGNVSDYQYIYGHIYFRPKQISG